MNAGRRGVKGRPRRAISLRSAGMSRILRAMNRRTTHFTPQSSYTHEELLNCGNGLLFGPGNAQLPLPPLLMFDRITTISADGGRHGKGLILAELEVLGKRWFFDCRFTGDGVRPGGLGLDAMGERIGFFVAGEGGAGHG